MKHIKSLALAISALSISIFFYNCGGNDPDDGIWTDDGGGSGYLTANTLKSTYKAYEVAGLSFSEQVSAGNYQGAVDSISVDFRAEDSLAWFMVPNLGEGFYDAWVVVDGDTVMFSFEVAASEITDADAEINRFVTEQVDLQIELDAYIDSLIADSVRGFEDLQSDKLVWAQIAEASKAEIDGLDADGKMALAQLLNANQGLFETLDEMLLGELPGFKKTKKEDCVKLIKQGKQEIKDGKLFTGMGTSVLSFWCSLKYVAGHKDANIGSKAFVLFDNLVLGPGMSVINTVTNFVGRRIDALSIETQELTNKVSIPDLLEELESAKKQRELIFRDGEPEPLVALIKFRSIDASDVGTEGPIGGTADFFNELISVYDKMIEASEQPLVWRPGFEPKKYAVRKFNRFLSIDKSTVSNSDIVLINTQTRNDTWEAAFGNDGNETEPKFTFELVYDDGEVRLEHTVNAKIVEEISIQGQWKALEIDGKPMGTKFIEYREDCPDLIDTWFKEDKLEWTFQDTTMTFISQGASAWYNYTGLDSENCTYDSYEIEEDPYSSNFNTGFILNGIKLDFYFEPDDVWIEGTIQWISDNRFIYKAKDEGEGDTNPVLFERQ